LHFGNNKISDNKLQIKTGWYIKTPHNQTLCLYRGKPLSPQWIKKKYITTVAIYSLLINWLIDWFLLNVKWIIFQLFSREKQIYGQSISLKRVTGEWDQYRGVGMNLKRTTSFKGVPKSGERGQETFKILFLGISPFSVVQEFSCFQ
jgi:hypothetical protein